LTERIESTQVELQAVAVSLDTQARKLQENLEDIMADFITNIAMVDLGAKGTIRETLAQQFIMEENIEANKRELQVQLAEDKAVAERGNRKKNWPERS
jgi:hypothetical protein